MFNFGNICIFIQFPKVNGIFVIIGISQVI